MKTSKSIALNIVQINQGIAKLESWLNTNQDKIPTFKILYECLNINAMYIRSLTNYVNNNYINNNYEYIPTLLTSNNNDNSKLKEMLKLINQQKEMLREEIWFRALNNNIKYLSPKIVEMYLCNINRDINNITNNNKITININIDKNKIKESKVNTNNNSTTNTNISNTTTK